MQAIFKSLEAHWIFMVFTVGWADLPELTDEKEAFEFYIGIPTELVNFLRSCGCQLLDLQLNSIR